MIRATIVYPTLRLEPTEHGSRVSVYWVVRGWGRNEHKATAVFARCSNWAAVSVALDLIRAAVAQNPSELEEALRGGGRGGGGAGGGRAPRDSDHRVLHRLGTDEGGPMLGQLIGAVPIPLAIAVGIIAGMCVIAMHGLAGYAMTHQQFGMINRTPRYRVTMRTLAAVLIIAGIVVGAWITYSTAARAILGQVSIGRCS